MINVLRRSYFLPLAALFALTLILVPPLGDFPLNDDWVYAWMARTLLEEHRFVPHVFTAAYGAVQTVWGAAFCAVFGYSFTVLRISTLTMALAAVWLTARCARELGATRGMALMCGAVLFANPLFLNLSYTFMTEVPFIALMMGSGFFYLRALRTGRSLDVLIGSTFAVLSFCNRQYGLLSTVAFAGATVFVLRSQVRRSRAAQWAALFGPWLVLAVVFVALAVLPDSPFQSIGLAGTVSRARQIKIAVNVLYSLLLYLGCFLLPFAWAIAVSGNSGWRNWGRSQRAWSAGIAVFYSISTVLIGVGPMPRLPNMLRDFGVGPLTMYDTYFAHRGWSPVKLIPGAWHCITVLSAFAAGILVAHWLGQLSKKGANLGVRAAHPVRRTQYWFLFLWGIMLLISPLNPALTLYFDRYLLPGAIPFLVLAATGVGLRSRRSVRWTWLVPVAALYAFSLASVQDYLAWNGARWNAVSILRETYGATNEQIDGGYEFNGMYTSETFRAQNPDERFDYSGERPWWVIDDVYAISFLPRDGYEALAEVPYRSWLGSANAQLLILKRTE